MITIADEALALYDNPHEGQALGREHRSCHQSLPLNDLSVEAQTEAQGVLVTRNDDTATHRKVDLGYEGSRTEEAPCQSQTHEKCQTPHPGIKNRGCPLLQYTRSQTVISLCSSMAQTRTGKKRFVRYSNLANGTTTKRKSMRNKL